MLVLGEVLFQFGSLSSDAEIIVFGNDVPRNEKLLSLKKRRFAERFISLNKYLTSFLGDNFYDKSVINELENIY